MKPRYFMLLYVMVAYVSMEIRGNSWQPLGYVSSSILKECRYCDAAVEHNVLSSAYMLLCDTGKRDV